MFKKRRVPYLYGVVSSSSGIALFTQVELASGLTLTVVFMDKRMKSTRRRVHLPTCG
jgi:hypothetical protein